MTPQEIEDREKSLSPEQRDVVEATRREIESLRPEKRWLVVRQYAAEQHCELDAETAEEALEVARERFGWLDLRDEGPGCTSDIDVVGHAVYDRHLEDSEPVLEED